MILKVVVDLVAKNQGFLLDGFPRTLDQAQALDEAFGSRGVKVDRVINLKVEDSVVVARLSGRRVCSECGKIYHIQDLPPIKEGYCDSHPDMELTIRTDDQEKVVQQRLDVYRENTEPILGYYKKMGVVLDIEGNHDKKEITQRIVSELANESEAAVESRGQVS
ncbi:adenylate kinase [bacterium]|nr:adenylate kinase [bacterium]